MRFETNYRDEDTGWAGGVFQYTWMIDEDSEAGEGLGGNRVGENWR